MYVCVHVCVHVCVCYMQYFTFSLAFSSTSGSMIGLRLGFGGCVPSVEYSLVSTLGTQLTASSILSKTPSTPD